MNHLEEQDELLRIDDRSTSSTRQGPSPIYWSKTTVRRSCLNNHGWRTGQFHPFRSLNAFGSHDRTLRALGRAMEAEIGDRMVAMMKPDIGLYMRKPWKGLPLLRDALAMPPKKVRKGKGQRVRLPNDLTNSIPKRGPWTADTLSRSAGGHQRFGRRAQPRHVPSPGAQRDRTGPSLANSQARCRPHCQVNACRLLFASVAHPNSFSRHFSPSGQPLKYQFAGILGQKSLPITKALTQDLWVPAEADIIIEGYCDPPKPNSRSLW